MFKLILVGVVVLIVAFLGFVSSRPNTFRIQRSVLVQAPPEKIFPLINDFHQWSAWSPYEKKDPGMQRTYSGAANGKGAVYTWEGNGNVGKGRMEIEDTTPPSQVTIRLDFEKPMVGHNVADFTLTKQAGGTSVTWAMSGPNPFIGKLMHTFFNMDKMVGDDFEVGLNALKAVSEK